MSKRRIFDPNTWYYKFKKKPSFHTPGRKLLLGALVTIGGLLLYGGVFLPDVRDADELHFPASTIIYDRQALDSEEDSNDHILYVIHGDENREFVKLEDISPWAIQATLAIEDDNFYWHFGFDIGGMIRAVLSELGLGKRRGGSTITQQLVKQTFLSSERTYRRKFNELLLAMKMEWHYSKRQILELYLNKIPYGHNAHGIEAAARKFFNKSASDLTIAESAILASLPAAPTRFSPYGSNRDLLMGFYEYDFDLEQKVYRKGRKDLVLQRMLDEKMITFEQFQIAWSQAKALEINRDAVTIDAPHFVFYVRQQLEDKYGQEFLRQGGLRIYTTLDSDMQNSLEEIVATKAAHYPDTYGANNVAALVLDNSNGEILAYLGGDNFFDTSHDGQVDVLTSSRQPGSSFKPFVYAAAFEAGYSPATVLFDVETDFGGNYKPQNYDGEFLGPVSMRQALNASLNIPAIKAAYLATPKRIIETAKKLGINLEGDANHHGVAIGIGVAEVEPLSHIAAYQVFANNGSYFTPRSILEIHDAEGNILEKDDLVGQKKQGLDQQLAALVRNILTDETTRPTTEDFDWNILLQLPDQDNGVKTGTSNRQIQNPDFDEEKPEDEEENPKNLTAPGDAWTIGFTPHVTTGVWVGNNRGEPMKLGATGLAVAAPIWKSLNLAIYDILTKEREADKKLDYPALETELKEEKINKFSGKLATDLTPPKLISTEIFADFALPTEIDDTVQIKEVDKLSGRLATRFTPAYARTTKHVLELQSILPERPNWQNPVQTWLELHPLFVTSLGTVMDETPPELASTFALNANNRRGQLVDDIHNKFTNANAPEIKIISPRNNQLIARGPVAIKVAAQSRFGIKGVEFYWDNQLVYETNEAPYTGYWNINTSNDIGSTHLLTVVAIDKLLNTSSQDLQLKIGLDQKPPHIAFLGPVGNQSLPVNSLSQILLNVSDSESMIKKVDFYFDDKLLSTATSPPWRSQFITGESLGRKYIKAVASDSHGNIAEKSIPISINKERVITEREAFIDKIVTYRESATIELVFPQAEKIAWAEVLISDSRDNVYTRERISNPQKFTQLQVAKNFSGRAKIELLVKIHEEEGLKPAAIRTTNW